MKREYTEEIHAQRVKKMFENRKEPCGHCPAQHRYGINTGKSLWSGVCDDPTFQQSCCSICNDFINIVEVGYVCPCDYFEDGEKEAIKRTRLALEQKGYI